MACKIRNLTDSAVQSAITNVVVKTAGKYKPEGTTLSIDTKDFSLEELTSIVEKWSTDTYKTAAFTNNWFTVNETPDKVVINFTAPNKLVKAYEVKLGIKSLDQVNNELMGLDEDISLAQQSTTTIKPGVEELFESNTELANEVYEAAGIPKLRLYRVYNPSAKGTVIEGQEKYTGQWFTTDLDYALSYVEKNKKVIKGQNVTDNKYDYSDLKVDVVELNPSEAKKYLLSQETILKEKLDVEPDNFIIPSTITRSTTINIGGEIGISNKVIKSFLSSEKDVFKKNIPLPTTSKFENLLQLEQQAQQLYSQYLESLNKPNTNPILKGNQKPDVILPIGTSGSGKSTFIKSLPQENLVVIEPDAMRVEFTGDMNNKSKDKEIYEEAAKRAVQAIKQGKQVVFDTTNLTKDKRLPFIEAIKKEIPNANIQYKLMELNPELAKQRIKADIAAGKNRANVPDATIDRHAESYKQMLEDIKNEPISNFDVQQEQVKKFAELQERLNNKEFLEGAKNAFESSEELQQFGTQEQYSDYIARVSLGIVKNPSSGEYNYESQVKDIVYHGANEPIEGEKFAKREGATGRGIWFSGSRKYAQIQMDRAQPSESLIGRKLRGAPTMYQVVLNIKNPKNFYNATGALLVQTPSKFEEQYDRKTDDAALFHHPNSKKPATVDSADQVVVFEPEQIHILGGKQDIEGFKEFAQQPPTTSFYQETGSVPIVFDSLENLTDEQISELESTVKYSLDEREQDDLLKRGNTNVYYYLKDRDADKFDGLVKRNDSFPSEFKIEVKTTRYEKREGSLAYDSWNEYRSLMFYKLNKNKKSNLYKVVDTESGEEIMSKVRVLSKSKNVKEEIADKYGLEFTPTTVFSANRSIAFSLYLQKPNKKKYVAFAKKYLYDAIKFLNPDESGFKNLNFDLVEQFLAAYPEEMWDYINTTYSPEDSTNINASIKLQNSIKFKLPKLGLLTEIEKITGIKLQGESFKNYDRSGGVKKVLRVEWGEVVVIDYKKMTTKQLRKAISYYLQKQNYFKPSSEEQNVRKYAEHKGIDYNELRKLVFGDLDEAIENIAYNTTGNSDEMEVSKWRESIREYNWQAVELFSKPYEDFLKKAKDKVIEKFKDKTLSNGISHLDYFFSGNFNWLNINFNNISGQYYGVDMETESGVGVEKKMGGIINPFEMSIYTKPKPGKDFLKSEEVFNRLAAILHEPFHALHALSYGTREELDLRKAFKTLYETSFGKKMINEIFGGTYNNQNVTLDVAYKEFAAFTAQLMLFPKSWIQSTDLRSNDIYEFFEKVATLSDKTYTEIVKSIEKIGTEEVTVTKEEFIKLNFLQKLYNYIVKALAKVIPLSKKFFEIIPQTKLVNETVIKDVFGETEKNVVRTVPLPAKLKAQKEEFLTAMDEFKTAINTLMSIDSELFSSDNTTNFFRGQSFYQEASTPQEQPVSVNTLDQEVSIKLPSYDEQVEEFFQNAEDSYNPGATYSQEQSSFNFGNEAITTLMQVLSDNLGVPFEIVESSEEAAKILRDSGLEYNNEPAFFFNGKVYFVQNKINAEIVFHEFAHPLIQSIRISNPKLFNQLYDQLLSTPEGQAILERVQRLYNYTGDRLKEEVIVTAIGLQAEMSGTGKTVSKPYKTWLDKIMFHIKQFLRKLFGNKITVEKLSPNTTLKQLVDMMTGETFALNSEVFTTDEVAEFIKLEVEDQKLFVEAVERNGQEVINLIASAQVAAQEFEQLIKRSNDVELKKILDNDPVLKNIKSTVSQARQSVTAIVGDAIAKNQQASSVIYALMGYEQILNNINANVNAMRNLSATAVTPESIARILYYNDLAQYIDTEFISVLEEALNVPGTGLATAATNRQALREVINALQSSRSLIDNIKKLHNIILEGQLTGFLTELTKDMNVNINLKFGERFKEIAEKGGASEALAEKIKEKLLAHQDLTPQELSSISKGAENALNKVIKEYKGVDITPEKIRAELVGETSNMNWLNAYLEGYSASQNLISGPFFAYLKNKYAEVDAEAASISADMINELQPYLKNLSKNEILLLGKAVAFEDTVADLDDKGELVSRKVWSYLNQFQNYRYDLSKLEYTLAKANESKDQDAIRKAYMELRQFKRDYMWQKYDKSFYDVEYDVYDKNDVTRDALREKEILLNELKIERTPLQTEQDRFNSYSKIRALERQLKELSKLTYEDGTDKIDDPSRNIYDKTKALTHREYNERIKKFYEYNLIEGEFQRALQSFESSLIAEGLAQEEIDKRINEWLDQNTRVEFSEQYFVDKQNAINALEYFISTKFPAGARNQRVVDIHRQISDLLILARDPSGQIDISVLSKETRTLIKDLQEEIIQIQKDQVNASGLSSNEWARYNYLSKKPSMLTPTESNEYAFLRDKLNSMGLNKTDKETYYRLLGDISELTSKKPTQDYIDTVNYWLSGKLGLAELNEEEAEKLTEKNTADYYMSLDGDFRDWFLDNHVVRENKDGEYYERVYIWNRIQPDERYLKKTTVELSDGSKRTIDAVPGSRFYKRSVKKEFMTLKTDDWSKYVGVYIDNTNLSDNPNFLPRPYKPGDPNSAKDDRYINKDFQNLDKNSDIAKILEIIKKYHLKTQSFASTYGKLYLDLPRFGIEDNQELILRGEIKKKALRTWTQVKGLISKEAREEAPLFPETGGDVNYDTQRNMIRVNSLGEEQEYIPIGGLSRLEIDQVSLDVIRTTHKYLFSALRYKQLSEMDPLGRALRDFTSSEENALKDTKKVNRNIYRTKGITKFAKSRRQDLRALQISHLYDREFLGVQNNDFGNNPYLNKITKFFMKQVSFGFFALDLVSATKNWGGQVVQNVIESAGGKYISVYSLAVGSKMAHQQMVRMQGQRYEKGNPSLETQLLLNFDPGQSYFSQNFGKTQARSFISDVTSLSFFMSPRKFLERQSVLEMFFGMMHHKVITRTTSEGVVNIRYIDAWELDGAGKLKLKDGVDKKYDLGGSEYAKFKTLAQSVANKLYGAYSDIDLPMANKYYAYKITTFLRRFFTEMFMNRFGFSTREGNVGGYRYNWAMSNVERGYYVEGFLALLRMFNVSNKYWQFMSKDEKYALRKITMELAILVVLYMMSTILFGYDPDDEERYRKLRAKSGDMFSDNFNIDWWLAQHTILFAKNVFAETSSFIPLPKLGLEDIRDNADLTSLVFGRSIGQMGTLAKDIFYMSIGSEKALYTRNVGPFPWQEKESYKIYNHLFNMMGVKGKFYDPVGRGIMPQESVEARK